MDTAKPSINTLLSCVFSLNKCAEGLGGFHSF